MNDQLSNKIQEQIDANQITPLPRWRFLLLRGLFWFLAILSVVVGAFAVAAILFLFIDYHRHGLFSVPHDITEILLMIPFLWIAVFVLFIGIAREGIKHTRKGYQYRLSAILSVSIALSIILGSFLNFLGIGKVTHELLSEIPLYSSMTFDSRDAWTRPVEGRLAGVVFSIRDNSNFSVVDFGGRVWQVHLGTSTANSYIPEASSTVRMAGMLDSSSSVFIVRSIHEWEE